MFILHFKGFQIASAERNVRELIDLLPFSQSDRHKLWGLWSCADALVIGDEALFSDPNTSVAELLDCIEHPDFRYAYGEPGENDVFEDVIAFAREHQQALGLTVSIPA